MSSFLQKNETQVTVGAEGMVGAAHPLQPETWMEAKQLTLSH